MEGRRQEAKREVEQGRMLIFCTLGSACRRRKVEVGKVSKIIRNNVYIRTAKSSCGRQKSESRNRNEAKCWVSTIRISPAECKRGKEESGRLKVGKQETKG